MPAALLGDQVGLLDGFPSPARETGPRLSSSAGRIDRFEIEEMVLDRPSRSLTARTTFIGHRELPGN